MSRDLALGGSQAGWRAGPGPGLVMPCAGLVHTQQGGQKTEPTPVHPQGDPEREPAPG